MLAICQLLVSSVAGVAIRMTPCTQTNRSLSNRILSSWSFLVQLQHLLLPSLLVTSSQVRVSTPLPLWSCWISGLGSEGLLHNHMISVSQISIYASFDSAILRICCPFFGTKDPHILNPQKCHFVSQKCSCVCVGNALQTPLISYFTTTTIRKNAPLRSYIW